MLMTLAEEEREFVSCASEIQDQLRDITIKIEMPRAAVGQVRTSAATK